eukprot:591743-Alexandrium_andersonii.AAC.1
MSASLVGSEMCIRDSHSGGRHAPEDCRTCRAWGRYGGAGRRACRRRRGCLLYTSDAADDM